MALDPKLKPVLDRPEMQFTAPPPEVTAPMVRDAVAAARVPEEPLPIEATRDLTLRGAAGPLRARLYLPTTTGRLPLVVFFHGGGFVLCDLDTHDNLCRLLATESGCAVAAVEYRLAPEARFPAPLEDCYAALCDLVARAGELGLDGSRVAVAGDSAGANLATATCLLARERRGPTLLYQALFCPCLDATCSMPSMRDYGEGYMLSAGIMEWFWNCYVADAAQKRDPLVSPLFAPDLAGLPPASITTAECDPLRDEGERYAERLREAGVPVVSRRYGGMIHDFVTLPLVTEQARNGITDVARDLRTALGRPSGSRVATAQRLYRLALSGDFAGAESLLTEDYVIQEASALPFAGTYRGPGALRALFEKVGGLMTLKDVRFEGFLEGGDVVVVMLELVVEGDGGPQTIPVMERLRFRGERVAELQPFYFDSATVHACVRR